LFAADVNAFTAILRIPVLSPRAGGRARLPDQRLREIGDPGGRSLGGGEPCKLSVLIR
jgi:hypothetical protein